MLLMLAGVAVPARAAGEGRVTVLAFGDSLTQGYGLPQGRGLVPQLQDWLDAHDARARVINGGVSGDTTAGGAARIAWSLTDEVDAIIVALGGNDMLRGIDPAVSRGNLDTILTEATSAGVAVLLVGMRAPGNYGAGYKRAFEAMYAELAERHGVLLHRDFFSGLGAGTPAELMRWFQRDGLHPNSEGVARIVAGLGPSVLELLERARAQQDAG